MEPSVFVPASVYNKNLNNQSITKQDLPKCQKLQNPTYQIDSLKKEMKKNLFAKADSLNSNVCHVQKSGSQIQRLCFQMV